MYESFFPGPVFGWIFLSILWVLLILASYTDLRFLKIPKWITLSVLALGLIINITRGIILGWHDIPAWILPAGVVTGSFDGLLFSIAGFGVAFALFFAIWMLGIGGGGDVKLVAALGAWIGPYLVLWVLGATVVLVGLISFLGLVKKIFSGKGFEFHKYQPTGKKGKGRNRLNVKPKDRLIGFSLPLALACIFVLPWAFRIDLFAAQETQSADPQLQVNNK